MLLGWRGACGEQCCAAEEEEFHASSFHCSIGGFARLRCSISDQNACSACPQLARCWFLSVRLKPSLRHSKTLAVWAGLIPAKIVTKRSVRVVGRGLASYPLAPPRPEEKKAQPGPRLRSAPSQPINSQTWLLRTSFASPAAPRSGRPPKSAAQRIKHCSCWRNGKSGRAHEDTECVTAAHQPTGSILLHCGIFVAHRAVTTVRARDVAPRKILVATPH